jgi:cytochrome b6-f complex iron-sulfur subunit
MNRETFIRRCAALTAGLTCMDLVVAGCAPLPFATYAWEDSVAIVHKSSFGDGSFVLLDIEALPAPVYVSKQGADEYTAVVLRCTHRGCRVRPAEHLLECPCHGSRYSPTGAVVRGPAPENLRRLPVENSAESLRITVN